MSGLVVGSFKGFLLKHRQNRELVNEVLVISGRHVKRSEKINYFGEIKGIMKWRRKPCVITCGNM